MRELTTEQAFSALANLEHTAATSPQKAHSELAKLVGILPTGVEVQSHLSNIELRLGLIAQAIERLHRLDHQFPANPSVLALLGRGKALSGDLKQSILYFERTLQLQPDHFNALVFMSDAQYRLGNYKAAEDYLRRAIVQRPSDGNLYSGLANYLIVQHRHAEAIEAAQTAIDLGDESASTQHTLGIAYSEIGRLDEARQQFSKTLDIDPLAGPAYLQLATITQFKNANDPLIQRMQSALENEPPIKSPQSLHFALGKAFDNCGLWEKAWAHYSQANLLAKAEFQRQRSGPGARAPADATQHLLLNQSVFSAKLLQQLENYGSNSLQPVFVVGMPRSGTTLIEQIIASHPAAAGAGELDFVLQKAAEIGAPDELTTSTVNWDAALTERNLRRWAEQYLHLLTANRQGAQRIVDKAPDNYLQLGLIQLMFPRASIIHVARDPLDTTLSCFFQPFREVGWSFDQSEIAERFLIYRKTMDFWRKCLPKGRILEIQYEELVNNPEPTIRTLIAHVGLDWNSACLSHHAHVGSISTSSVWQARQPIYGSSIKRWRNYAENLTVLVDKLGPALAKDDKIWLRERGLMTAPLTHLFRWPFVNRH